MNTFEPATRLSDFQLEQDRLQTRFGRRIAHHLDKAAALASPDIGERLRFARELAVRKARLARVAEAAAVADSVNGGYAGTLTAGGSPRKAWWLGAASLVPLLALVAGLVLIQRLHVNAQIRAAADIDAALLIDDLPPAAYADPVFAEYLRAPRD